MQKWQNKSSRSASPLIFLLVFTLPFLISLVLEDIAYGDEPKVNNIQYTNSNNLRGFNHIKRKDTYDQLWADDSIIKDEKPLRGNINLYTLPGRFSPIVLDEFTRKTGYQVRLHFYQTFNELLSSSQANTFEQYDLLLIPGSTIKMFVEKNLLEAINMRYLPNKGNTYQKFVTVGYHQGQMYGVPLFWWLVGILKQPEAFSLCDNKKNSWQNFFDTKCHQRPIVLPSTSRFFLGLSLQSLGHSFNSISLTELEEVQKALNEIMATPLFLGFASFEQAAQMCAQELLPLTITTNMAASQAIKQNPKLTFVLADEGVPASTEVLALSSFSKNKKIALEFINFFLEPEVAAENADYADISTANFAAWQLQDAALKHNLVLYPDEEVFGRLEFPLDLGDHSASYQDIWQKITGKIYEEILVY